ncbi:MAG: glycosyltransferase [Saprospiraceae bacterium]|nr:glycosyltransferase [Saprospiraceae bacterium]HPG09555.1 glycosyltransferase [Saprospiraceae bacterium]
MQNTIDPIAEKQHLVLKRFSAKRKISLVWRLVWGILLTGLLLLGFYWPIWGFILFVAGMFNYLFLLSYRLSNLEKVSPTDEVPSLGNQKLSCTILVPLKNEGEVIGGCLDAIRHLDYPDSLKELLIIVEDNDAFTLKHLNQFKLPDYGRVVLIPPGYPATKGRSLLYGLKNATGDLITVFDAESRPEKDQLQKAAAYFSGPEDLVCVQSRVIITNKNQNWITQNFAAEYYEWFYNFLQYQSNHHRPFGLGGNSFYVSRKVLIRSGAWDPFNVTEDADLSVRLVRQGVKFIMVNSSTSEECPRRVGAWLKQRTRWNKGLMVTQMVHLVPSVFKSGFGLMDWISFWTRSLSGSFLPFFNIFILFYLLVGHLSPRFTWKASLALWSLFAISLLVMTIVNVITFKRIHVKYRFWQVLPGMLGYMALHILAGFNALIQYLLAPLKWNKTDH